MGWQTKKWGVALGMATALVGWSSSGHTQVFDTPSDFTLEALQGGDQLPFPGIPLTLNIGNFQTNIVGPGEQTLNEVAIAGISQFTEDNQGLVHRIWTLSHTSSSDTRALVQDVSDITVTDEFDPFYLIPDSLTLVDLNGDGADDVSLLGAVLDFNDRLAGLKLQKSGATGPVGVFGIPSQAGPQYFETSINLLGQQTDSSVPSLFNGTPSQPSLTQADFDGDGLIDLAFYDFLGESSSQVAVTLANNGTFGTLPRTDTTLALPAELQGQDFAYNLIAADIDGDGAPDLAITFDVEEFSGVQDQLLVFKGNGDGTFVPEPIATALLGEDNDLAGLTVGNFDGNDFLDFAVVTIAEEMDSGIGQAAALNVVLCSAGGNCSVDVNPFDGVTIPFSLASGDFNEDGLDDIAAGFLACSNSNGECEDPADITSGVAILLNDNGSFSVEPDQVLPLGGNLNNRFTLQVVSKDIDGCGGPDLAYIGFDITQPTPTPSATPVLVPFPEMVSSVGAQGLIGNNIGLASVAFNHNDDPVADAGQPVQTESGVRVGGEPTCSGEPGEVLSVQWTVVSGSAVISDPTAANPTVDANTSSVLQVTCTDACGASSSSTVTVNGGFLLNGTGCSLGQSAAGGVAWLFGLIGLLPLAIRRIRG